MSLRLDGAGALRFGLNAAAVSGAIALMALVWSLVECRAMLDSRKPTTSCCSGARAT